jgi:hypothetical protein
MSETQPAEPTDPVAPESLFDKVKSVLLKAEQDALAVEHAAITDVESLVARLRAKL